MHNEDDLDVVALSPAPSQGDSSSVHSLVHDENTDNSGGDNQQQLLDEKKYFCQRCLNHGLEFTRKGHKPYCKYASCNCDQCRMVEQRRQLNNMLSRKKVPIAPSELINGRRIRDPKCARCSAHGIKKPLRGHKKASCQFKDCRCTLCGLVENRRSLMAKQIKLRRDQQRERSKMEKERHSVDSSYDSGKESDLSSAPPSPPIMAVPRAVRFPVVGNMTMGLPLLSGMDALAAFPQVQIPPPTLPFMFPNMLSSLPAIQFPGVSAPTMEINPLFQHALLQAVIQAQCASLFPPQ